MKKAASSADSGAPPERTIFTRPPRRSRILRKTSLSAMDDLMLSPNGIGLPLTRYGRRRSAISNAPFKIFCFHARWDATLFLMGLRLLSQKSGPAAEAFRRDFPQL